MNLQSAVMGVVHGGEIVAGTAAAPAQPEVQVDEVFESVRLGLRGFRGVRTPAQPEGFTGQLRDYQREGVGWMEFLREFGFGGCLADDMGVSRFAGPEARG